MKVTLELCGDWKNFENVREKLTWLQQPVSRRDVESTADEVSEGSEKHVIRNQREGGTCGAVAGSLAELSPEVYGKQNMKGMPLVIQREISKQSEDGTTWFLLATYSRMCETGKLRETDKQSAKFNDF